MSARGMGERATGNWLRATARERAEFCEAAQFTRVLGVVDQRPNRKDRERSIQFWGREDLSWNVLILASWPVASSP
jgi:hypothetical protein